jgi:hypothetical protein
MPLSNLHRHGEFDLVLKSAGLLSLFLRGYCADAQQNFLKESPILTGCGASIFRDQAITTWPCELESMRARQQMPGIILISLGINIVILTSVGIC